MLCEDLDGWDSSMRVGGKFKRERIYGYIYLIRFLVQQKLIQYCKAIILHFKKKKGMSDEAGQAQE